MPTGIRTVVPAIMLALFFVVLAGGASPIAAQDIQATPIMDDAPEPKVQPAQSRSIGPAATEGAFREWVFPESFFHGALTSHRVGVNANTQGIYYGATPRDIAFTFQWSSQNSAGLGYSIIHVEGIPSEVQLSLPISGGADISLAENCHANSGQVVLQLTFTVTNLQTNQVLESVSETKSAPCTVQVTPLSIRTVHRLCGPANNLLSIPNQPEGITVTDSGWQGTERTFSYSYAAWVETTVPLLSTTIVDEDPPCDASVTITAPESLPRLPDSDQYGVTVGYDFGNAWPEDNAGIFVIELPSYNGKSEQQISNPVGEYTFYPFWTLEDTARRCIAGEGKISTDVKVTLYPASGAFIDTPLWSYTGYVETDCSIAVEPRPATYIAEACGYTDDRIQVPIQSGIHNHTISWDGNVATITYIPMPVHEIIGGPFTVTITEDPCVTEPVPDPVQTEICGVDNDLVEIGDDVEGVLYHTSDGWIDNTYDVRISPQPGWVLPEGQQTEFALVDEGDCVIEGLTAPVHIEVCGVNDDTVHVPEGIENVTITTGEMSVYGTVTVTYTPDENYMLPEGIEAEYTFVDEGDCLVTPNAPEALVAVCGPDNDILSIPSQPEGITVEDSGWVENERVIEFIPAEGYAIAEGARARITFSDDNIPCEVDPVGTTLVLRFETSDGGSLEGKAFRFYAPVASQQSGEPFIEGEIGAGNKLVLEEIIAGTYRIAVSPEGYEPIDELIIVTAEGATEEHVIGVQAIQPVETPTPSPTVAPTVEPTPELPAEPTKPAVTGLPQTGTGSGTGFGIISTAGLLAAMVLSGIGNRLKRYR